MILIKAQGYVDSVPCPHTRGDDPDTECGALVAVCLSPHAWG